MSLFRQVRVERSDPVSRDRSELGARCRRFRAADGLSVVVPTRLVERACEIGRRYAPNEWMGLLVGTLCRDRLGTFVEIEGIVPDPDADVSQNAVQTSPRSEARMRAHARALFPDLSIVGWTHGHLSHGAYYSSVDRDNQASSSDPNFIGIVFDPWSEPNMAVYHGPDSEPLEEIISCAATRSPEDGKPQVQERPETPERCGAMRGASRRTPRCSATLVVAGLALVLASVALGRTMGERQRADVTTFSIVLQRPEDPGVVLRGRPGDAAVSRGAEVSPTELISLPDAGLADGATHDASFEEPNAARVGRRSRNRRTPRRHGQGGGRTR